MIYPENFRVAIDFDGNYRLTFKLKVDPLMHETVIEMLKKSTMVDYSEDEEDLKQLYASSKHSETIIDMKDGCLSMIRKPNSKLVIFDIEIFGEVKNDLERLQKMTFGFEPTEIVIEKELNYTRDVIDFINNGTRKYIVNDPSITVYERLKNVKNVDFVDTKTKFRLD